VKLQSLESITSNRLNMLIELQVKMPGVGVPVIDRVFFDTETGGISTMPALAERGNDKDSDLARHIAWALKRDDRFKQAV
jgi:hypothetical protein